ncbi:unnamed protein product, partial [Didymodactylos carnosus]
SIASRSSAISTISGRYKSKKTTREIVSIKDHVVVTWIDTNELETVSLKHLRDSTGKMKQYETYTFSFGRKRKQGKIMLH